MAKKIIIIGGGIAGLSAGIYGQMNGFSTEIIEMHTTTGGQCTAWDRFGYRFDYCLHWLVGTSRGPFHDIWKETNVITDDTVIIDHEIYAKIVNEENESFFIYADINRWEKYLISMAPEDKNNIVRMCNEMRKGVLLEPFSKPPELLGIGDYFRAVSRMLPILKIMNKYKKLTCAEYFNRLGFKNVKLRQFLFDFYGGRDFSALAFLLMLAFFNQKNAGYLMGGSMPLAHRMTDKYISLGGTLTLGTKVKKIVVEKNIAKGVILDDNTTLLADYVISAADGHSTLFDMLEGSFLSKNLKKAYAEWELFMPIVQVSFGIKKIIPSQEINTFYITKTKKIGSTPLPYGYSIMNYQFDPSMAPEGKSVLMLRYETPWEIWSVMNSISYKEEKEMIKADALAILESHYHGITENIEVIDVATPLTDVKYTGVWKGSYEGFLPSGKNFNKNLKLKLPGLKQFYMAGQWLFPGGGLPPSAQSGKWAIQLICRDEKIKFITN